MRAEVAAKEGPEELDRAAWNLHVLRAEGGVAECFNDDRSEGGYRRVRDRAADAD